MQLFRQCGRAGLKLGHIEKMNIQNYILRRYILEGTRMKIYNYDIFLHEEDKEK